MQIAIISKNDLFYERFIYLFNTDFLLDFNIVFFDVLNFNIECIKAYDLIILDENSKHLISTLDSKILVYFSDEKNILLDEYIENINIIYKYQDFRNIKKKIFDIISKTKIVEMIHYNNKSKLIYIYSNVSRCGKSILANNLANILSKEANVLLISFDIYEKSTHIKFSDLFYSYLKSNYNINFLKSIINEERGLYYIAGVYKYEDIYVLNENEYIDFFNALVYKNIFDYVVIDAANINFCLRKIIEKLELLIVPYIDESYSNKKIKILKEEIENDLSKESKDKIKYISFKETKDFLNNINNISINIKNEILGGE